MIYTCSHHLINNIYIELPQILFFYSLYCISAMADTLIDPDLFKRVLTLTYPGDSLNHLWELELWYNKLRNRYLPQEGHLQWSGVVHSHLKQKLQCSFNDITNGCECHNSQNTAFLFNFSNSSYCRGGNEADKVIQLSLSTSTSCYN